MGPSARRRGPVFAVMFIFFLGILWGGCSSTVKERQGETATTATEGSSSGTGTETTGKYYFDDVRVPQELNYDSGNSFIYETPKFKAGILIFSKWRLDVQSIIDFFNYHMEKDNWKLVNSFRGKESFLNFSKPDKTCTIRIKEKWTGTTTVEIRLGPLGEKKM